MTLLFLLHNSVTILSKGNVLQTLQHIFYLYIFHIKGQTFNDEFILMTVLNPPGERKLLNEIKLTFFLS